MAVVKNRVVVPELLRVIENLNDDFLTPIRSMDDKVNNETINFNEIGADPDVLIDNTSYPIATAGRTDDSKVVALKKLETENTKVTDDEIYALGYDKKSSVMQRHAIALKKEQLRLAAWSLTPASDAANTPVIKTTGTAVSNLKALLPADLIALKAKADLLEIPLDARYLVLCSKHANDLLAVDQSFRDRYYNTQTGKVIANILGFQIYESVYCPKFVGTTDAKKAYGAAAAASDANASFFYSNINAMKAKGSTKMYLSNAEENPENRESVLGFRQYFIVSPVQTKAIGAIIDHYTGA